MSTMLEEEDDVSDDADPDVIRIRRQHQKRPEIEAEWSSEEERGHLLNTAKHEILVVPSTSGNNVKRVVSRDDSPESIPRDKGHRRRPQPRLVFDQADSGSSSDRDNGLHSPGRSSVRSIDPRHYRHYCANVRSPRTFSMDENHQYCPCCHQLSPTWASLYTENNGSQARSFPDTISIRSLASIGLGSSDGRKLTIRRVPTSPSELLNVVHPPPFEDDVSTCTSYDDLDAYDSGDYRQPRRLHWANKMEFVLACIGYSVGLGNVWRFPYLCYKSGGGVFLVPYFLILVVCGVPLLYMELSIGQFTRRGPIGALGQVCPLLKGAGLSSVVISFLMWNSPRCWLPSYGSIDNRTRPNLTRTPSEDFFDNKVLQISSGIEEPGILRWELVACLITAWIMVYFSIWKSIKSSAQVRYLTATLPFLLIVVFLTRSLTLEGAAKGLQFFFHPRWELLGDAKVWINAAAQVFNSVGIAFGSMICFASYNRFHNTILVDTVAVSLINAFSSLLVGIFSFATIGNIALEQNMSVDAVLTDGPGLVFVIYPQALAKMPASQLWAVLFFFMLVCLSLNSQFAVVEVVVTSIQDGFPNWVKRHLLCHEVLVLLICVISFLFGLPNITQGGIYFFQLIDHYAASMSIMFLAFFEVIAISWLYGVRRLCNNVKEMTGRLPSKYFRFCWFLAAPLLIMAVWVFSLIDYEPPTYHNGDYIYPWWAEAIGWGIASLSLICIPAFAVCVFIRADGATFAERFKNSIKPHFEACKVCGQEYCMEPMHNLPEDMLKEPQTDMNTSIQLNSYNQMKPQT
ncbi:sodium- and chloride-dependent GABA transporter ine [Mycetomoellerius zeteki]|uniref:sodium- and chloride-dependent GABA transporter ine n=1 Tax=Mycetomoellerius zeteki TaxID=64791 RepID=UPI00084EA300|nr:PREDICTED: sodium- and chloride-dependent GABA transporter ine-like [Trachymyrmex zeteki]